MGCEVIRWSNASFHVNRWFRCLYYWEFTGYIPGDPTVVRHVGITYTAWGARRRLRKILLESPRRP